LSYAPLLWNQSMRDITGSNISVTQGFYGRSSADA